MRNNNQQIQDQFGASAELYRTSRVHATGADLKTIAQLVANHASANRVLDLGCGAGHTTMAVAPHAKEVVAFDLTENMLAQVQSLALERGIDNVTTQQGTVEALPFEDESFDILVTRYSAHHWTNPQQALSECFRVLKSGGFFLLCDVLGNESPQTDTVLQAIELLRDHSHVRDHNLSEWQRILSAVGFTVAVDSTWQIDIVFEDWLQRMNVPSHKADMIRTIFSEASDDIQATFQLDEHCNFVLQVALLKAEKPS